MPSHANELGPEPGDPFDEGALPAPSVDPSDLIQITDFKSNFEWTHPNAPSVTVRVEAHVDEEAKTVTFRSYNHPPESGEDAEIEDPDFAAKNFAEDIVAYARQSMEDLARKAHYEIL